MESKTDGIVDLIVLGAGPAGVAAAITAKNAGLKVCVVTKATKAHADPYPPVQSVHPGVLTLLKQLELLNALKKSTQSTFSGIEVNGRLNRLNPDSEGEDWQGYHINRQVFDTALLESLEKQSVPVCYASLSQQDIWHGEDIITVQLPDDRVIYARYGVDATGYDRLSRRTLDLTENHHSAPLHCWTGVCRADVVDKADREKTQFLTQNHGWLWLAPNDEHAITWTQLIVDKRKGFTIPFGAENQLTRVTPKNVRWRISRPICTGQLLLCGDAAGILDPAAGQGILNALMSGIMAAKTVVLCINQPELKNYYYTLYDQWFTELYENRVQQLAHHYQALNIDFANTIDKKTTTIY